MMSVVDPTAPRGDGVKDGSGRADWLRPAELIDSDHPAVVAFAKRVVGGETDPVKRALALYYAVRDEVLYDPYNTRLERDAYKASACLRQGHGYCINKAGLMAAVARASGLPARVGYADVRNHMTTRRLSELMGSDVFYYHGYVEIELEGRWVKATPAFNRSLTDRFRFKPLDWDGRSDSIYHPFDIDGRRHMEYLAYRGLFADIPFDEIRDCFAIRYPKLVEAFGAAAAGGDFAREAGAENPA